MRRWHNFVTVVLTIVLVIDVSLATDSDRIIEPFGTLVWPLLTILVLWLLVSEWIAWRQRVSKDDR